MSNFDCSDDFYKNLKILCDNTTDFDFNNAYEKIIGKRFGSTNGSSKESLSQKENTEYQKIKANYLRLKLLSSKELRKKAPYEYIKEEQDIIFGKKEFKDGSSSLNNDTFKKILKIFHLTAKDNNSYGYHERIYLEALNNVQEELKMPYGKAKGIRESFLKLFKNPQQIAKELQSSDHTFFSDVKPKEWPEKMFIDLNYIKEYIDKTKKTDRKRKILEQIAPAFVKGRSKDELFEDFKSLYIKANQEIIVDGETSEIISNNTDIIDDKFASKYKDDFSSWETENKFIKIKVIPELVKLSRDFRLEDADNEKVTDLIGEFQYTIYNEELGDRRYIEEEDKKNRHVKEYNLFSDLTR